MSESKATFSLRKFQSLFALAIMVIALALLSDKFSPPTTVGISSGRFP